MKGCKFKGVLFILLAIVIVWGISFTTYVKAQTIYTDTIPEGRLSTNEVYVQEDLLYVLEMTPEEFKEQIVKKDLANQDEILYYSGITNNIDQKVNTLLKDTVYIIPNEELPPSGTSTGLISQALNNPNDGYYDEFNKCANTNFRIVYGNFSNKGSNTGNIVVLKGNISENAREKILSHELGHGVGGNHPGDGPLESQPGEVQVVTERLDKYAEAKGLEDATLLLGYPTIMGTTTNVGIYGHPQLNPDLEANVAKLMQQDIINSPQPLLVQVEASSDTIKLDNVLTLHATINRESEEIDEYLFYWAIIQDEKIVYTDTGSTIEYMPTDTGTIDVELFVQKSCGGQSDSASIQLQVIGSSTSSSSGFIYGLKIYPNPTNGLLNIPTDIGSIKQIGLINTLGKTFILPVARTVDISSFHSGIYYLQVESKDGTIYLQKILKQ